MRPGVPGGGRKKKHLKSRISKVGFRMVFGVLVCYIVWLLCFDTPIPPLFQGTGGGFESNWLSILAACSWSRFLFQVMSCVRILKIVG